MSDAPQTSLLRSEAEARADLLTVRSYDLALDLDQGTETFGSVTTVVFDSRGGETFVDLKPQALRSAHLNGEALDVDTLQRGRLPLRTAAGENTLVVDAVMAYRNDGEGLHRSVDPADDRHYVYGMSFMDAAPRVFACFDQPDLKAPYTLHVRAPQDWVVVGNGVATRTGGGEWELATTAPLSTYFVTLVAGPYHLVTDEHDGIPLGLSARQSLAGALEKDAEELLTITRQSFDELHRLFGIRYAFGAYHQAFVPEFNAGAMENPGCVTFRDQLVFDSRVTRTKHVLRASTIAHEMAHQWFGNLTTPRWWDDLWLNESFAEYMGTRVIADATQFSDARLCELYDRRQWGLIADQRPSTHPVAGNGAADALTALQSFDGISYAKGASVLEQLAARLGDDVFFGGVVDHFERHRFGNATMADLVVSWERAGAGDLEGFVDGWLLRAGADTLRHDRDAGVVRLHGPEGPASDSPRTHALHVARGSDAGWRFEAPAVAGPATPLEAGDDAVVLDARGETWALTSLDDLTLDRLAGGLFPGTDQAVLRATVWDAAQSALHNAAIDPARIVDLVEVALPEEDNENAVGMVAGWVLREVTALCDDPADARRRVHAAASRLLERTAPSSTLQLAAAQVVVASCPDPDVLRAWLSGERLPEGVELDLDLRWRILVALARGGWTDRAELDAALAAEPTAVSRVEHTRAVASLPDPEAKAWAWQRLTGEADVSNYEIEAAGLGMWRPEQSEITGPYVQRYLDDLPGTVAVRNGWVLADTAENFFPWTAVDPDVVERARALAAREGLDSSLARRVGEMADDLDRRVAVRRAYGRS